MKMIGKAFAKMLFGANYERLTKALFIYLIVFWGLHIAAFQVDIAPFILYLMVSSFTADVMWQALSSKDDAVHMRNMFMLPFESHKLIFSYVAVLGAYTLLTKTAALFAIVLAVSDWDWVKLCSGILCALNAILMSAAVYAYRKHRFAVCLWTVFMVAMILFRWNQPWFIILLVMNGILATVLLLFADAYSFYPSEGEGSRRARKEGQSSSRVARLWSGFLVWKYFLRYMKCHRNYLLNTIIMWGVACVLPVFFKQMESGSLTVIPIGFAILSLNTPICILLSSEPALQQTIHFLPGQERAFCVPYCLFIFACNLVADLIFLGSMQILNGGVTILMLAAALFFSLQSAACSVLLEWFYPVTGWKIESDLWHHPRKYIVPVVMLLVAGMMGTLPGLAPAMMMLLAAEASLLLIGCRKKG